MKKVSTMNLGRNNELFFVEKILRRRIVNERVEYFIKWKNFSNEHNTWEPVSNLHNVAAMIKEFERKRAFKRYSDLPVEKILAKRMATKGRMEYLVKWLNWPEEFNSWESETYFRKSCRPMLLEESDVKVSDEINANGTANTRRKPRKTVTNGLEKGLQPQAILGATNINGCLQFLVEFSAGVELVSNQDLRAKRPDLVIQFYEKRIRWAD